MGTCTSQQKVRHGKTPAKKASRAPSEGLSVVPPKDNRTPDEVGYFNQHQIGSVSAESLRRTWSKERRPLPEYQKAADTICLQSLWLGRTKLGQALGALEEKLERMRPADRALLKKRPHVEQLILRAIQKAYGVHDEREARARTTGPCGDDGSQLRVFETMCKFCFEGPPGNRGGGGALSSLENIAWALETMVSCDDPNSVAANLLEVCDRVPRCQTAHIQAYGILITHAYQLTKEGARTGPNVSPKAPVIDAGLEKFESARERFEEAFEDFLDDYKRRAFISAFLAPAQCYLKSIDDHMAWENMHLHGHNWYLALLQSTMGVMLPMLPYYDDPNGPWSGITDFWSGLNNKAWEFFADPSNFGKYPSNPKGGNWLSQRVGQQQMPHLHHAGRNVRAFANEAVNPSVSSAERRKQLAKYLERFAYFFRFDCFVRRAFETLNAETKPEHAGFRRAAQTLYETYRIELLNGESPESLIEYAYKDDSFMELDTPSVGRFFAWLGVVRHEYDREQDPNPASIGCDFLLPDTDIMACLVSMGFGKARCASAVRQAGGDPTRAVEILVS